MEYFDRSIGERIVIDDHIVVEVVEIEDAKVRVGIKAPQSVHIVRLELIDETEARRIRRLKVQIRDQRMRQARRRKR